MSQFEFFAHSDMGSRQNNEDAWGADPEKGLFALADGMGGHLAGEVASREAVEELCLKSQTIAPGMPLKSLRENLKKAIGSANLKVFHLGQENPYYKGMGTTLCCFQIYNNHIVYAHVGDSRIYLLRNNVLKQLTKDHSLINSLSGEELMLKKHLCYKSVITKAIGIAPFIRPSLDWMKIKKNDIFFMCSDGLSDYLSKEEMQELIKSENSLKSAAQNLIRAAKEAQAQDNITVLMLKIS